MFSRVCESMELTDDGLHPFFLSLCCQGIVSEQRLHAHYEICMVGVVACPTLGLWLP